MPCCSSSTRSSCSRSERAASRPWRVRGGRVAASLIAALALLVAGCGEEQESGAPSSAGSEPESEGTLRIAARGEINTLDPLLTSNRVERLAARQIYEPLVSTQAGPFGQTRRRPGLLQAIRPVAGGTIWIAKLRPGVRFGDGEPLDADAVIANATRWLSGRAGTTLLRGLAAVDSPRPGRVRFLLDRPVPRFERALANPHLGVVAPDVLAASAAGEVKVDAEGGGTGPYELREQDPGRTLLARRAAWWGTRFGLGPGVDQIEFLRVEDRRARADQLREGGVDVADGLRGRSAHVVDADPLLSLVGTGGVTLGVARSVRGIDSAEDDQSLADVWLTGLR